MPFSRLHIAIPAAAAVLSMAAAPAPAKKPMTEQRLLARVGAQWDAWRAMNLHGVFMLYAPSYRKTTSELAFNEYAKGMLGITPIEYKIGSVELSANGSKATVHIDAQTDIPPFGRVPNKLVQQWAYEQGDWWRLIDPPAFPTAPPATSVKDPMGELPADPGTRARTPMDGVPTPASAAASPAPRGTKPGDGRNPAIDPASGTGVGPGPRPGAKAAGPSPAPSPSSSPSPSPRS